ncbi:MAG: glycogen-binding domain-containing protein [Gemmatimonadaceae bacterium]|nr:glycogen-binding domain-containing protein [Gemmatimonadaceae bacterium]
MDRIPPLIAAISIMTVAVAPTALVAQSRMPTELQLGVHSGAATDQRGMRSQAWTLAPAVSASPLSWLDLRAQGSATQFADAVRSIGGGGLISLHSPASTGVGMRLTTQGSLARTTFNAQFTHAQAQGALEWRPGAPGEWLVSGGPQVGVGTAALRVTSVAESPDNGSNFPGIPGLPGFPRPGSGSSTGGASERTDRITRTGVGAQLLAQRTFRGLRHDRAAQIAVRYSSWNVNDEANLSSEAGTATSPTDNVMLHDVEFISAFMRGPVTLVGSVGHREAPDERRAFAAAHADVMVVPHVSVVASAGSYPRDRIAGTMSGRYVTAGLRLSMGGVQAARSSSRASTSRLVGATVRGENAPRANHTRIAIKSPKAKQVELAGDWNNWQRIPARQSSGGVWYVDVPLTAGEYRYTFLIDGTEWRVPDGVAAADDGFGSKVAWVIVRAPAR